MKGKAMIVNKRVKLLVAKKWYCLCSSRIKLTKAETKAL